MARGTRIAAGRARHAKRTVSPKPRRAPTALKAETPLEIVEESLYASIRRTKEEHRLERLAVAFYDSHTTLQWAYNAESYFHAASTIKIAVLVALYGEVARGRLTADAPVHVRNRFTSVVGGAPFAIELDTPAEAELATRLGKTMTVRDLAREMIARSSNFATNLLVDVVGVPAIQKSLEELGVEGVLMKRAVADQVAFEAGINNEVTANGVLKLLRLIAEGRAYSPETCAQMLEILLDQRHKGGIPAGLPEGATVAHKTGNISTVHHDAGIVYIGNRQPYFLVVLTQFPEGGRRGTAVAEVSRDIFGTLARFSR